jgi:membrane protein required for colicin V production
MVLDLVVIGILLVSAAVAFLRGFVREIFTIGSLLGAAFATLYFGPGLVPTVEGWLVDPAASEPQTLFGLIPYSMLVPVVAFALVFTVAILLLTFATFLVSKGVHSVGLGPVDRSLGVVFGLVRGFILIGLMGMVFNFVLSDDQRETYFGQSKTYGYVNYTADLMQALLPGKDVIETIKEKKDRHDKKVAATGKEPLEPGQTGKARSGNGNYANLQRQAIQNMAQPEIDKLKKRFND